jgi:hypothetical protein
MSFLHIGHRYIVLFVHGNHARTGKKQKIEKYFWRFFLKFRKGNVHLTFLSQKLISEKLFSKHVFWTAAVLNINSASKVLVKSAFFVIKMASESHFKTIQQLTCFVMKNRVQSIFFTSDFVLTSVSCVLFMPAPENNLKLKNIFSSFFSNLERGW